MRKNTTTFSIQICTDPTFHQSKSLSVWTSGYPSITPKILNFKGTSNNLTSIRAHNFLKDTDQTKFHDLE